MKKVKVLFLCTGNSCRSQMAEGWAKALKQEEMDVWSAGIEIHGLNPDAVAVMAEAGIDISGHTSKTVSDLETIHWDFVVTVCDHAHDTCPYFPSPARVVHAGFDDPPKMAAQSKAKGENREKQLDCYRRIRDEIKVFVKNMPENLVTNEKEKQ